MEVTQFAIQQYNDFKSGKKPESEIMVKAMEQLSLLEKDSKSEFNLKFGGVGNLLRVRIMRDGDDSSGEISLIFVVKDQPNVLEQKKAKEEVAKTEGRKVTFPLFVPDVKATVVSYLKRAVELASKSDSNRELVDGINSLLTKIEGEKTLDGMRVHRVEAMKLAALLIGDGPITDSDPNKEDKRTIYACLDVSQAALALLHRLAVPFDKKVFIETANSMRPKHFTSKRFPKKFTPPNQAPKGNP